MSTAGAVAVPGSPWMLSFISKLDVLKDIALIKILKQHLHSHILSTLKWSGKSRNPRIVVVDESVDSSPEFVIHLAILQFVIF